MSPERRAACRVWRVSAREVAVTVDEELNCYCFAAVNLPSSVKTRLETVKEPLITVSIASGVPVNEMVTDSPSDATIFHCQRTIPFSILPSMSSDDFPSVAPAALQLPDNSIPF